MVLEQQVLRGIAAEGELGEQDDLRARLARLRDRLRDHLRVALDVTHDRVELGEGEAQGGHRGSIARGGDRRRVESAETVFRVATFPARHDYRRNSLSRIARLCIASAVVAISALAPAAASAAQPALSHAEARDALVAATAALAPAQQLSAGGDLPAP